VLHKIAFCSPEINKPILVQIGLSVIERWTNVLHT
jgi:hypothetical protein